MAQPTQNIFFSANSADQLSQNYSVIQSLTLKDKSVGELAAPVISDNPALSFLYSPLLFYGSVALFFLLFLGAIGIQLLTRVLDWKKTATTFVVALMLAILPMSVRVALNVTSLQTRASPDEVPHNVRTTQLTTRSEIITWETDAFKVGAVRFAPPSLLSESSTTVIADGGKRTQKHTARIENLEQGGAYEFEILSGSQWYTNDGQSLRFKLKP